jgi:hypothetical protein
MIAAGVPLKQLWYHDAVLFLSPAASLSLSVYEMLIINRCYFLCNACLKFPHQVGMHSYRSNLTIS